MDIIEVFVNEFIWDTNNADITHLLHLSRCMLHGIYTISPRAEINQQVGGDPVYDKKINKGERTWTHKKEILGCIFNGQDYTLRLPAETIQKILDQLQNIKKFTAKTPREVMEKLSGSLQHISFGIPGGSGIFFPIQVPLKGTSQWLRITPDLTQCLQDCGAISKHMGRQTSQVRQMVNNLSHYIG